MKAKAYHEHLSLYRRHIFYGNDPKAIEKLVLKTFKPNVVDVTILQHDKEALLGYVAALPSLNIADRVMGFVMFVEDKADIGTIAHESTHLTNHVFDYLGVEFDCNEDEHQAYLLEHFCQTFLEKIRGVKPYKDALLR